MKSATRTSAARRTVAVTGAKGFVGSCVVAHALEQGYRVRALAGRIDARDGDVARLALRAIETGETGADPSLVRREPASDPPAGLSSARREQGRAAIGLHADLAERRAARLSCQHRIPLTRIFRHRGTEDTECFV